MPKKTTTVAQAAGSEKITKTNNKKGGAKTVTPPTTPTTPSKLKAEVVVAAANTTTVPETTTQQEGGKNNNASKKRTFKIKISDNEFCSRITGNTPKQAASKALTLIVSQKQQAGKLTKGKIVFTIKETTRGSKGKEYVYQGEKVKLKQPTTYKIRSPNGEVKEIINRFRNVIEKFQE